MTGDLEEETTVLVKARQVLDRSVQDLDPRTLSRLRQARRSALASSAKPGLRLVWAGWVATAAAVFLVAGLWMFQPARQVPGPALEELELLTSSENLDFYDELEFYGWLAETGLAG